MELNPGYLLEPTENLKKKKKKKTSDSDVFVMGRDNEWHYYLVKLCSIF